MEDSVEKKRTVWHWVICVGLVCLIWGGYFLSKYGIENTKHRQITIFEDDFSWVYQIDEIEDNGKEVVLKGFAFELNVDAIKSAMEIVLQDIESGKNYFLEMEYESRTDVNEYFLCEHNYLQSGFLATIKSKKLDLQENDYEVLLRVLGEETTYRTGTYISEGKIMYTNPMEYEPLDVKGTDLEHIVENGVLRVYRPDYGMYVYQYEGSLYWIAESDYDFNEDRETYVQWHLETTQKDKLPEERLENQWYFDNLGFEFKEYELQLLDTEKYRVAVQSLPNKYAISQMNTGKYIEEWIWKQDFRPFFDFEK